MTFTELADAQQHALEKISFTPTSWWRLCHFFLLFLFAYLAAVKLSLFWGWTAELNRISAEASPERRRDLTTLRTLLHALSAFVWLAAAYTLWTN